MTIGPAPCRDMAANVPLLGKECLASRTSSVHTATCATVLLNDNAILIVETEVGAFVTAFEAAVARIGAATLVARTPMLALEHCRRFRFAAALVNAAHRDLAAERPCRSLLYTHAEEPKAIVASLKSTLSQCGS